MLIVLKSLLLNAFETKRVRAELMPMSKKVKYETVWKMMTQSPYRVDPKIEVINGIKKKLSIMRMIKAVDEEKMFFR